MKRARSVLFSFHKNSLRLFSPALRNNFTPHHFLFAPILEMSWIRGDEMSPKKNETIGGVLFLEITRGVPDVVKYINIDAE